MRQLKIAVKIYNISSYLKIDKENWDNSTENAQISVFVINKLLNDSDTLYSFRTFMIKFNNKFELISYWKQIRRI